jgi:DNA-binding transcriptional LysR family regulator
MTIRHLKVFIAVCQYGKMSVAARKLHIAQPSISQTISEIEQYYEIKLFERLSKKLFITEAGKEFLNYARHIIALFDEMEENISMKSKNISLKIGATITIGTCVLNDILQDFETKHPEVKTQIIVENTGVIEEMLLKSELDIGIVEGEIKSADIITVPILSDELILVCSALDKFSNLESINISQLQSLDFVMREKGSGTRELFEKALQAAGISVNEKWTCNNSEAIKNAVINGQGLTVISKMLVEKELQSKQLHSVLINDANLSRDFHVAYHKNKYLSESLRSFMSTCLYR